MMFERWVMSGAGFQAGRIATRHDAMKPHWLFSSCAVAAALVAAGSANPAFGQAAALPNPSYLATASTSDAIVTNGVGATPSTTINVTSNQAIINWTPLDNATNTTSNIIFQAGGTATFITDLPGFTVL